MIKKEKRRPSPEEVWRIYLTEGAESLTWNKHFFRMLPSNPRCKLCYVPFKGAGGAIVRALLNKRPSTHNPLMCNTCEQFAARFPGGAEVDMVMLFADIRGSTTMAEKMSPLAFSQLINRFYNVSSDVLIHYDAFIDRLVGDEMIGYFMPGSAGADYPATAVRAALKLMEATGNTAGAEAWAPIGIGIHKGKAFFGAVGKQDGVTDITALGDAVNTAARLASQAGPGEILISEEAYQAAGMDFGEVEERSLALKGRSEPVRVRVVR